MPDEITLRSRSGFAGKPDSDIYELVNCGASVSESFPKHCYKVTAGRRKWREVFFLEAISINSVGA